MNRRLLVAALVVLSGLTAPVAGATDETPEVSGVQPEDLDHGGSTQTIRLGGEVPAGKTALTVDVTPLSQAGVDLSNASASVARPPAGLDARANLKRVGDRIILRTALNATEPTGFRLRLRLEGLNTSGAETERLRYDGTIGSRAFQSDLFQLEPPGLPDLFADVEGDQLTVDRADASQRLRVTVLDTPPGTPVTVSVNLRALEHAGVSMADLRASATIKSGDLTVEGLSAEGSTVELRVVSGSDEGGVVALNLAGIDTRTTGPADGLRYRLSVDAPAGTKTVTSDPFGIYRPSEAPTPTETVVESPTATRTRTLTTTDRSGTASPPPGASGGATGFTVLGAGVALAILLAGLALRTRG